MPLDPPTSQMLEALAASGYPPLESGTPESARQGFRLLTVGLRRPETVIPVAATEDVELPGRAGPLRARIYRTDAEGLHPTVVFFHGGGFVIGDLDTHDNQCRSICRNAEATVLSVDYRLAPEHAFPAAIEDGEAALQWSVEHIGRLGGDSKRLALAGDSAGGNLAAVLARRARDAGGPPIAAQLLIYPATDFRDDDERYPSRVHNGDGYFLTRADMHWFRTHYLGTADPEDQSLSPLMVDDLSGLPPAVVAVAEYDPLRDEGEAYAHALEQAGVAVTLRCYPGLVHGFFDFAAFSPASAAAVRDCCAELRRLLG